MTRWSPAGSAGLFLRNQAMPQRPEGCHGPVGKAGAVQDAREVRLDRGLRQPYRPTTPSGQPSMRRSFPMKSLGAGRGANLPIR